METRFANPGTEMRVGGTDQDLGNFLRSIDGANYGPFGLFHSES